MCVFILFQVVETCDQAHETRLVFHSAFPLDARTSCASNIDRINWKQTVDLGI